MVPSWTLQISTWFAIHLITVYPNISQQYPNNCWCLHHEYHIEKSQNSIQVILPQSPNQTRIVYTILVCILCQLVMSCYVTTILVNRYFAGHWYVPNRTPKVLGQLLQDLLRDIVLAGLNPTINQDLQGDGQWTPQKEKPYNIFCWEKRVKPHSLFWRFHFKF
jgi:hypothetical protein